LSLLSQLVGILSIILCWYRVKQIETFVSCFLVTYPNATIYLRYSYESHLHVIIVLRFRNDFRKIVAFIVSGKMNFFPNPSFFRRDANLTSHLNEQAAAIVWYTSKISSIRTKWRKGVENERWTYEKIKESHDEIRRVG